MKIGIVTAWFPSGAGYVSKAYREVLEKDNEVYIYARGGKIMRKDPLWDDEMITWAPRHYNGIKTSHLIKWAKEKKIDLLFFNEQRFWKPVIAAKEAGICIGSYVDYYTQLTVPAFEVYDFLICNTKRHLSVFDWHKNAFYIPWGTDTNKFKPAAQKKERTLAFIMNLGWGGLYKYDRKGLLLAIEAFSKVEGDCQLLVYSQVELSNCLKEWQESISKDNRIKFISGTFDPFPYSQGDVYLYPSRLDGIGLSLPEALSSGLPSITTDCAPMNEFVQGGENGTLVKVEKYLGRSDGYYWAESWCNIDSLKNAMQKYVGIDKDTLLNSEKEATRQSAELKLNWELNSKGLNKIFQDSKLSPTQLKPTVTNYALRLDRTMAPSLSYRILALGRDLLNHVLIFFRK